MHSVRRARPRLASGLALCAATLFLHGVVHASDTLLINGHIYTANPHAPWAQSVAISHGKIDAVGTNEALARYRSASTRVIDLQGHTVLPGIFDAHVHSLFGSMALHGLNLSQPQESIWPDQADELVARLKAYARAHPNDKVIFVRANFATSGDTVPSHTLLDRGVSDRPVIVHNVSEHALWLNGKALELAGVTAKPVANALEEKYIVREADGKPRGVLLEASMELAERAVLRTLSTEEKLSLLRAGQHYLNSFGITSVVNATGSLDEIELYAQLRDRHQLTVRTRTAFGAVAVPIDLTPAFLRDLQTARDRYHDPWVGANLVKFFADGATPAAEHVYDPAQYHALVRELDQKGFQVMTHALRADNAHMVLDTYQQVQQEDGPRDRRFRMEHADRLEAGDVARFGRLGVFPSMQPTFCCNVAVTGAEKGDRWHSLIEGGATLVFSSDWPCTWPPDPFVSIQQAVTRNGWSGRGYGAHQAGRTMSAQVNFPEERITVMQAIDAYTRNAAYASFRDHEVGSLEPGKYADLVVLSQDIFAAKPLEISNTHATMTMVGGEILYGNAP
jgi:predicted amidohydrolase YtcJ